MQQAEEPKTIIFYEEKEVFEHANFLYQIFLYLKNQWNDAKNQDLPNKKQVYQEYLKAYYEYENLRNWYYDFWLLEPNSEKPSFCFPIEDKKVKINTLSLFN